MHNGAESANGDDEQTFYATATNIDDLYFEAQGVSVNDINYRGGFALTVMDETKKKCPETVLSASDFDIRDTVSVLFSGKVSATYPAAVSEGTEFQLADDKK